MATHLENNRTNEAKVIIDSNGKEGLSEEQFFRRYGVTPAEALKPATETTKKKVESDG